jgi:hypothetical protein
MTPTQKKFLLETLGVKPKTKLIGKGNERVQATTAFEDYRKREAAVIKKIDELRKIKEAAEDVRKFEAEVEAAQARTKTAKKGDVQDVKAKCEEAEGMLAVTEKAVIVAIKAQSDPKLKNVLSQRSQVEGTIANLEVNPALKSLVGGEIAKARSKIAGGLSKAYPGKDVEAGKSDMLDAQLDLEKAMVAVAREQVAEAERQVLTVETHAGGAAVAEPEIKNMRTKIASATNKFTDLAKADEAMKLLAEIPNDCKSAKIIAVAYVECLAKLQDLENKVNTLPNPDNVIDTELGKIRTDKIDEAKKQVAHTVRGYGTAGTLIEQGNADLLKAKKTADEYSAYKLSKAAAENAMTALTNHADKDLVTKETAAIQTDLLNKAVIEGTAKKWVDAKKLYDEAKKACDDTKAVAQKVGTDNFKNYKTWGLDQLALLTSHAQKTAFAEEIARIEKRLESVRAAVMKGVDNLADSQIQEIYFDCQAVKTEMDRHATYVAKRQAEYDPKKSALPANNDPDFAKEVDAIEKQLLSANKRADRRQYDDADKLLQANITACVDLQKHVDERKAYIAELKPVGEAVDTLPGDEDPVIGNESKTVRALLASAKSLATAKDFKTAKERLPEVQKACDDAKKLAGNQAGAKKERDEAVGKDDPAVALAEVRKMYDKLGKHAQSTAIKKQLEEIDKKLKDADVALKA